ncbi:MAG TPA: MFS transporter [Desulfosalsimonadaceae bacterium]|nr:MFS transporter [Desulfosalsimonadaceae bacterium]
MNQIREPLPSGRVIWGIGSFQALAMFRRGLFYAYLSIYLRYFLGLSVTGTTLFATLPMIFNILSQTFIWGRFSDARQLRRTLILWGEAAGALGTVLVWVAHILTPTPRLSGFVIILGLAVVEIFWSMSNIGWSALISDLFPERKRNEVLGYLTSIGGLGRLVGIWLGGLLYDGLEKMYDGWGFHSGTLFFIAAGMMLISMIPVFSLPEGGIRKSEAADAACDAQCEAASVRLFWIFLIAMVFINFGRNGVMIIQSQYLFLDTGFAVSSKMLSYIFNTETVALILFGLFAGRIGRRVGNGRAVCLGAIAAIVYLVLFALADRLSLIFLASFFRGGADVIILAASYAMASILIPPERRGRLFGFFNATLFLSWGVAGTCVAGPIVDLMLYLGVDQVMAYRSAYLTGLIMVLIGLTIQAVLVYILLPRAGISRNALRGN